MSASPSAHDDHHHLSPFQRMRRLIQIERESLWVVLVYALAVGVLSLGVPLGVQALVGTIAFGGLRQPLLVLSLLVLGAIGLANVLRALQWAVVEKIQQRVFARSAFEVACRLPHRSAEDARKVAPAELVNRFFDVVTVQKGAATLLVDGIFVVLQAVVGSVLLAFYHPFLLAYVMVLMVVVVVVLFPMGRHGEATAIEESKAKYAVVAWFQEIARHPTSFRSKENEAFAAQRAEELTLDYLEKRRKHFRIVFRQGAAFLAVQAFATAALLGVGGLLVLQGQITLGQLIAAELIVTAVTGAFAKFGKYLESYYDLLASIDKVGHLTDVDLERSSGSNLPHPEDASHPILRADQIRLNGDRGEILKGVSFDVWPGDSISIVGSNGSGKSALSDVLWGLRTPSGGKVEVCGIGLDALNLQVVRERIALVRQDELFDGTIEENIRVGREAIQLSDLRKALEIVDLWNEISLLPGGTAANAITTALSPGQKNRLLLARAIAGKPSLLLVDGALDGIDASSRRAIANGICSGAGPWAVVFVTHDPSLSDLAAKRYHLVDGVLMPDPLEARS